MSLKELKSKLTKKYVVLSISSIIVLGTATACFLLSHHSAPNTSPVSEHVPSDAQNQQTSQESKDEEEPAKLSAATAKENESLDSENSENSKGSKNEIDAVVPTVSPSKDYSHLYPELYAERPKKQISPDKTIFLTFDDGPSARTAEILDILKENNIKATFFVIGNRSNEAKNLMKRIVDEGHTIAPHTYTHEFRQIYSSVETFLDDFNKIYNLIYENTGVKSTIFRFAGGSKNGFNKNNYRDIIAEMTRRGFDYFDWNLSTGDAAQKSPTPAVNCISNVTKSSASYNNAVVLMHDAAPKKTTVEALPGLIKELKSQGFSFDKLSNKIYPAKHSLIKPYA